MNPAAIAGLLVAYNAIANRWRPFHGWVYVPANLSFMAVVVGVSGLSRDAMGLRYGSPVVGALTGGAVALAMVVALRFTRTRELLRDRRLAGANPQFMVWVRIPIGTALVEEVCFRGVLMGALLPHGDVAAIAWSSVAFGLWHVVPTAIMARTNNMRSSAVVPAGVALTAAAGAFLGWMRIETGSVLAPFLTHALVNSSSAAAAFAALRSAERD